MVKTYIKIKYFILIVNNSLKLINKQKQTILKYKIH